MPKICFLNDIALVFLNRTEHFFLFFVIQSLLYIHQTFPLMFCIKLYVDSVELIVTFYGFLWLPMACFVVSRMAVPIISCTVYFRG